MNPALGPFAIAAVLLVLGGALKAVRPHDTAVALELSGFPAGERAVRAGGAVEALLGVAALVTANVAVATCVAISYAAFCGFSVRALARGLPIASCGCFGSIETPPSRLHTGITLGACLAAVGMALDADAAPVDVVAAGVPEAVAYVALVAIGVAASFALLTVLPRSRVATWL